MISEIYDWYKGIRVNNQKGIYKPHKALSILYALSAIYKNKRYISFNEDREELEFLIQEETNSEAKCLYPLVRLVNDNHKIQIWETFPKVLPLNSSGDLSIKDAKELKFKAGFTEEVYNYLSANKKIVQKLICDILDDNFSETRFEEILTKLKIDDVSPEVIGPEEEIVIISRTKRDPNFRFKILALYDYRCCFCNLKIYLNNKPVSMEAAHIRWKAFGGECLETNGLSLCPTHHYTFDKGLWTLNQNLQIELSPLALFDEREQSSFKQFNKKDIGKNIINSGLKPIYENILWHNSNIFKNKI